MNLSGLSIFVENFVAADFQLTIAANWFVHFDRSGYLKWICIDTINSSQIGAAN